MQACSASGNALLLGLCCGAIGFLIFGAAPTGPLFWIGIPVMSLWGVAGAAMQALMTRLVAPDQQGQLQGATAACRASSQLVGPFLFTLTFAYFIGARRRCKLPGAPFLLAAALMVAGARDRDADAGDAKTVIVGWAKRSVPTAHFVKSRREGGHGACAPLPTLRQRLRSYFFTSGHSLASSGLAASSAAIVAICL